VPDSPSCRRTVRVLRAARPGLATPSAGSKESRSQSSSARHRFHQPDGCSPRRASLASLEEDAFRVLLQEWKASLAIENWIERTQPASSTRPRQAHPNRVRDSARGRSCSLSTLNPVSQPNWGQSRPSGSDGAMAARAASTHLAFSQPSQSGAGGDEPAPESRGRARPPAARPGRLRTSDIERALLRAGQASPPPPSLVEPGLRRSDPP
jgi:hypothetical protein